MAEQKNIVQDIQDGLNVMRKDGFFYGYEPTIDEMLNVVNSMLNTRSKQVDRKRMSKLFVALSQQQKESRNR